MTNRPKHKQMTEERHTVVYKTRHIERHTEIQNDRKKYTADTDTKRQTYIHRQRIHIEKDTQTKR